jgi:hypothetical protein
MVPVDSSNVAAVGYDDEVRELQVQFNSGATYVYFPDVPRETYEALINSDSVGRTLNEIVKPNFSFRRIG